MLAFIIRRMLQAALVMAVVALIAFTLFRFVGDPINQMVGLETTIEERAALREALGLNDAVPVQLARFIWAVVHGIARLAIDGQVHGSDGETEALTRYAIDRALTGIGSRAT